MKQDPDQIAIVGEGHGDSRRTQAERRAESDSRMLRAATQLIAKHGSAGVSLAKIGVAAGYSRGLPTERYGSKSRLLEAVIDASDAWFQRRLAARLDGLAGLASLRERIRAHLETVRESRVPTVALFLLIIDSAATLPELRARVQRLNERWRLGILRDLESARASGTLPDDLDIERHALLILSAMHGVAVQALIGLGDDEIMISAESIIRELVDGIAGPG
ncbi:MAG: TetR family transcriptional regulator [Minwuia thermotolerans]|nr:MAG: TetR family transcriptional regulator [Minwuia thermotolerans]